MRSAEALRTDGTLHRAVGDGAVVLGVCAGYQLLGRTFPDSHDQPHEGLGLLDVTTRKGTGARAVGEVVATPTGDAPRPADGQRLPTLTGFENHSAVTAVGPGSRPVAEVVRGVGNGGGDRTEGAWSGRVPRHLPPRAGPGPQRRTGRSAAGLGPVHLGGAGAAWTRWTTRRRRPCAPSDWVPSATPAGNTFLRRLTGHRT